MIILDRLGLVRSTFVLPHSHELRILFLHSLPPRRMAAIELQRREQGRIMRSRRRPDERRQVKTAPYDRQAAQAACRKPLVMNPNFSDRLLVSHANG